MWNVLDRYAFYYCEMDRLEKQRWERQEFNQTERLNEELWPLCIAGRQKSNNLLAEIEDQIYGTKAIQYRNGKKEDSAKELSTKSFS